MMTSWENYEDFLQKLGVSLLLRKLATLGTPIVEVPTTLRMWWLSSTCYANRTSLRRDVTLMANVQVTENNGEWNIRRTTTIFYRLVKLRCKIFYLINSLFNSCHHIQGCRLQVPDRGKVWRSHPGQERSQVMLLTFYHKSIVALMFAPLSSLKCALFSAQL